MKWIKAIPGWVLGGIIFFILFVVYVLGELFLLIFFSYGNLFTPDPLIGFVILVFDYIQSVGGPFLVRHSEWWGPSLTNLGEFFLVILVISVGILAGLVASFLNNVFVQKN